MKKFCILTLTHESNNRPMYLLDTVESLLNNTEYDEIIDWFIYINKTNQEFISICNHLIEKYKVRRLSNDPARLNINVGLKNCPNMRLVAKTLKILTHIAVLKLNRYIA